MKIKFDDNETRTNLYTDDGLIPISMDSQLVSICGNHAVNQRLIASVENTEKNESECVYDILGISYLTEPTYELIAMWNSYISYAIESHCE